MTDVRLKELARDACYRLYDDCPELQTGLIDAVLRASLLAALEACREEERLSCCRAICPACRAGYPAVSRQGGWRHVWTRLDGTEDEASCQATGIRERGETP